jgi:hypothetical protein
MWCRPNSWKPGESISAVPEGVDPVPGGARGRVLAGVQRLRDLAGEGLGPRHQQVDQRALARARRAQHQRRLALQQFQQRFAIGLLRQPQRQRQHAVAHARGRAASLRPGALEGLDQVALVQRDQRRDALGRRRSARAPAASRRTRARRRSGPAPGRGWRRRTWCGSRPAGRTGCGAASPLRSRPRRRWPASARGRRPRPGFFLPRGWQMRRSPSGVSTRQWRPWLAMTSAVVERFRRWQRWPEPAARPGLAKGVMPRPHRRASA